MMVKAWDSTARTQVQDNPAETLADRLRAHLQELAILRLTITYREAAKGLRLSPPNTILNRPGFAGGCLV
jgi:hypothetical protein